MRVIIESPYGSDDPKVLRRNERYARAALYDSLRRGEAPFASHLLYTQVLCDEVKADRTQGIEAGLKWLEQAEMSVVYVDLGVTPGMHKGIDRAKKLGKRVVVRKLPLFRDGEDSHVA